MIFFDVTKTGAASHRSGLTRVSTRMREALGDTVTEVEWRDELLRLAGRQHLAVPAKTDWFFTSELFSEEERPRFSAFLASRGCRAAALFHDAIPLKHPHITWPQSVARHPGYIKLLARFDRVFAVSAASREELLGFWQWQGLESVPPVEVLPLGADFNLQPRITAPPPVSRAGDSDRPTLLCLGILEPRKNQAFLLDVCAALWREKISFELHLVGRVNPHFGSPIVARIKSLRRAFGDRLRFHKAASDTQVTALYQRAAVTAFPTIAEGCGLPLLESLWMGVPCVHSELPVLQENAAAGGCVAVKTNDHAAWTNTLRVLLTAPGIRSGLVREATSRALPTWADTATTLRRSLATT